MTKEPRHPLEEILEAAWRPEKFDPRTLPEEIRRHFDSCPECREFLDDLIAARRVLTSVEPDIQVPASETRLAVEKALRTAGLLGEMPDGSQNILVRTSPVQTAKLTFKLTLKEVVGFALMAGVFLGFQALALAYLKPQGFLGLHAILNWLAPFTLYAILRVDGHLDRGGDPV